MATPLSKLAKELESGLADSNAPSVGGGVAPTRQAGELQQAGSSSASPISQLANDLQSQLDAPPAVEPPDDDGFFTNLGDAFVRSAVDEPRIAFNRLTGDAEQAREVRANADRERPVDGGFAEFVGGTVGSLLPAAAAVGGTVATGGAGAVPFAVGAGALQGGIAAGSALDETQRFEERTGQNVNDAAEAANAVGNAVIVGLASTVGLGAVGRTLGRPVAAAAGRTATGAAGEVAEGIGERGVRRLGAAALARQTGELSRRGFAAEVARTIPGVAARTSGIEAIEETVEQVGQNAISNVLPEELQRGLREGTGRAFAAGAFGGGLLGAGGRALQGTQVGQFADVGRANAAREQAETQQQAASELGDQRRGELLDPDNQSQVASSIAERFQQDSESRQRETAEAQQQAQASPRTGLERFEQRQRRRQRTTESEPTPEQPSVEQPPQQELPEPAFFVDGDPAFTDRDSAAQFEAETNRRIAELPDGTPQAEIEQSDGGVLGSVFIVRNAPEGRPDPVGQTRGDIQPQPSVDREIADREQGQRSQRLDPPASDTPNQGFTRAELERRSAAEVLRQARSLGIRGIGRKADNIDAILEQTGEQQTQPTQTTETEAQPAETDPGPAQTEAETPVDVRGVESPEAGGDSGQRTGGRGGGRGISVDSIQATPPTPAQPAGEGETGDVSQRVRDNLNEIDRLEGELESTTDQTQQEAIQRQIDDLDTENGRLTRSGNVRPGQLTQEGQDARGAVQQRLRRQGTLNDDGSLNLQPQQSEAGTTPEQSTQPPAEASGTDAPPRAGGTRPRLTSIEQTRTGADRFDVIDNQGNVVDSFDNLPEAQSRASESGRLAVQLVQTDPETEPDTPRRRRSEAEEEASADEFARRVEARETQPEGQEQDAEADTEPSGQESTQADKSVGDSDQSGLPEPAVKRLSRKSIREQVFSAIGGDPAQGAPRGATQEFTRSEMVKQISEGGLDLSDGDRLLADIFVLENEGLLVGQDLVGYRAGDLQVGDAFDIDNSLIGVTANDADGVVLVRESGETLNVRQRRSFDGLRNFPRLRPQRPLSSQLEAAGDTTTYDVSPDLIVPANKGSLERGVFEVGDPDTDPINPDAETESDQSVAPDDGEGAQPGQQLGLLGDRSRGGITGQQQDLPLPEGSQLDADTERQQRRNDSDDGETGNFASRPGFANTEVLADTVSAALRAGRFTADAVQSAAQWLNQTAGSAVRNVTDAGRRLVQQFGELIRRHVPRIWQAFRNIQRNAQRNAIGAVGDVGQARNESQRRTANARAEQPQQTESADAPQQDAAPTRSQPASQTSPDAGRTQVESRVARQAGRASVEARRLKQGTVDAYSGLASKWSKPLIDVVGSATGDAAKTLAARAKQSVNHVREFMGEWAEQLVDFQILVSGNPLRGTSRRNRAAVNELQQIVERNGAKFTLFALAADKAPADIMRSLSPEARQIVEKFRELNQTVGETAQREGLLITLEDGTRAPFDPNQGGRLQRRFTPEMFRIMRDSEGAAFRELSRVLAKLNGFGLQESRSKLMSMRDQLVVKRASLEQARAFDSMPTHIDIDGQTIPLLHATPFDAATMMVQRTAQRLGFIREFGQEPEEYQALLEDFAQRNGPNDTRNAENLLKSLNGIPLDLPISEPGSNAHDLARSAVLVSQVHRIGLLTRSFIPNIPEPFAKVPAVVGSRRFIRSFGDVVTDPQRLLAETARMGVRTQDVQNFMMEPKRARESVARIARSAGLAIPRAVNEFNEFFASVAGLRFAKDVKEGKMVKGDRERLKLLGFTDAELDTMEAGKADTQLLNRVARSVTEFTQGTTSQPAERSRAANSKWWSSLVAFDQYAQFTFNRTGRIINQVRQDPKNMQNWKLLSTYMAGSAGAGGMAIFLAAMATDGLYGALIKSEELEDDPAGFLGDSLWYTLLGGPAEAVLRSAGARGADETSRALLNVFQPMSLILDAKDAFKGEGRFRNMDVGERMLRFMNSNVSIARSAPAWAAVVGLSDNDVKTRAAIRAYYRWRRDQGLVGGRGGAPDSEETERFRKFMRRATEEIRAGKNPAEELSNALGVKGKERRSVAASLRSRRLLQGLDRQQMLALKKRIGDDAFSRISTHDQLLDAWAGSL